jgi:hypothetical protein
LLTHIGAVQLNSSLLTLSVIAVLLPAAFHNAVQPTDGSPDPLSTQQEGKDILSISHGVGRFFPVYCPSKLTHVYSGCRDLAFQ